MLSAFTNVIHVSNLTQAQHFKAVLSKNSSFSPQEIEQVVKKLDGYKISVGVKKLLDLLDMINQMGPDNRVMKFLTKLEEEGYIVPKF